MTTPGLIKIRDFFLAELIASGTLIKIRNELRSFGVTPIFSTSNERRKKNINNRWKISSAMVQKARFHRKKLNLRIAKINFSALLFPSLLCQEQEEEERWSDHKKAFYFIRCRFGGVWVRRASKHNTHNKKPPTTAKHKIMATTLFC